MADKGVRDTMEEMTQAMKQLQASQQTLASRVESSLQDIESKLEDLQYDVNRQCSCSGVELEISDLKKDLLGLASYSYADFGKSKVYELRFYTFNLKGKGDFKELHEDREFWGMRQSFSRVVGIWETELNGSTEFFHFVEYDNLEQLFQARKALADSKEFWPKAQKVVEQYGTFRNCLTFLARTSPDLCTDFTPSDTAVYELQTMKTNNSTPTLGKQGVLVGRFYTVYGKANTEYRLIRFPDAQSAERTAKKRMENDYEMKPMLETRLMVPMPVSDLQ